MLILGIDPGISATGWALIEVKSKDCAAPLQAGTIRTSKRSIQAAKLEQIQSSIAALIAAATPDAVAMEMLTQARGYGKQESSEAIGVIRLSIWLAGKHAQDYNATRVKKLIAGYGRADKEAVAKAAGKLLGCDLSSHNNHVTDAFAIALTHAISEGMMPVPKKSACA